jgi:hypothetical protein
MSIRLRTGNSPVYHLQHPGHCYYLTRCGRTWIHRPDDAPMFRTMHEMSVQNLARGKIRLCKPCAQHWWEQNWYEIDQH